MTRQTRLIGILLAGIAFPWVAGAQNPQPAAPHEEHTTLAPPNAPQPLPEQIAPGVRSPHASSDDSLSDRLSRQQGTLQPPSVDPGIHVPVPPAAQGTMPVIPPPGTPGGNQKIVPK